MSLKVPDPHSATTHTSIYWHGCWHRVNSLAERCKMDPKLQMCTSLECIISLYCFMLQNKEGVQKIPLSQSSLELIETTRKLLLFNELWKFLISIWKKPILFSHFLLYTLLQFKTLWDNVFQKWGKCFITLLHRSKCFCCCSRKLHFIASSAVVYVPKASQNFACCFCFLLWYL